MMQNHTGCISSTVRFQMCPQMACLGRGIVTLVAFVRLFSTVCFEMSPQMASLRRGIVILVAFVRLFSQSVTYRYREFSLFLWYWYRYRKKLVPEKVSEPVSVKFGTGKKSRNRYGKNLVPEKSTGIGIVNIWYRKKSIGTGIV